jgi:dienelactone hydrolase
MHHTSTNIGVRRGSPILLVVFLGTVLAVLSSCANAPDLIPAELRPAPVPEPVARFARHGTSNFTVDRGTFSSQYGCTVEFEVYRPEEGGGQTAVVLTHGFTRDLTNTRGWARLWASRGVIVAVMSSCNSTLVNGHHDRNAVDMRDLAGILVERGVAERFIYAGHSAGGLSALLAARRDPRAVAYLGLDAVDSDNLAQGDAAPTLPKLFLAGEPSPCNAENNMLTAVPSSPQTVKLRVRHARHCPFEWPTDRRCVALCGTIAPEESSKRISVTIRALATAWIELHAGGPVMAGRIRAGAEEALEALREGGNIVGVTHAAGELRRGE